MTRLSGVNCIFFVFYAKFSRIQPYSITYKPQKCHDDVTACGFQIFNVHLENNFNQQSNINQSVEFIFFVSYSRNTINHKIVNNFVTNCTVSHIFEYHPIEIQTFRDGNIVTDF